MDLSKIGSHGLEDIISGMAPPPPVTPQSPNPISSMAQPSISPMDVLQGAQLPQQQLNMSGMQSTMPQPPPHGMFGIHGTARDILGMLGDAFLVQSGNKRVYAPQLAAEQEEQAMRGFTDDPMAAAERLGQTNPDAARKFYNDTIDAKRRGQTADEQYNGLILGRAMSLVGTGNADNWPAVRQRAIDYAKSKGVPIPDLPQNYDPEAIRQVMLSAVPPERQMYYDLAGKKFDANQDYRGARLAQGEEGLRIRQQATDQTGQHYDNIDSLGVQSLAERKGYHQGVLDLGEDNLDETGKHHRATEHQASVNEDKRVVAQVQNYKGELVNVYADGTTQPIRNSHPVYHGKPGRRFGNGGGGGGAPPAPSGQIIDVKSRAEADKLPPGSIFRTPTGQILRK